MSRSATPALLTKGYNMVSDSSSCPRTCFSLGPMFFSFHFTNQIITNVPFSLRSLRLTQGWSDTPSFKKMERKNHEHNPTIPCQTTTCDTRNIRSTPQSEDALMIMSLIVSSPKIENSYPNSYPPTSHGTHLNGHAPCHCHRFRRLHDARKLFSHFSGVGGRGGSP